MLEALKGERVPTGAMGTLRKVMPRLGEKVGKTHREGEWQEIPRLIFKHHVFQHLKPLSINPQGPLFSQQMESAIIIGII